MIKQKHCYIKLACPEKIQHCLLLYINDTLQKDLLVEMFDLKWSIAFYYKCQPNYYRAEFKI